MLSVDAAGSGARDDSRLSTRWYTCRVESEHDPHFNHAPCLCRVGALRAEDQASSRAARPDMGNLGTSEEDFILISGRKGYRPRFAAGTVQ